MPVLTSVDALSESSQEPISESVKPAQPAPKKKRKNAPGASESVPVPLKRPSAAAHTVSKGKASGVAAPAAEDEKNDEDDPEEVDETPGVLKRPSALRKTLFTGKGGKGDAKKKAHPKKKAGKPSDVTYHNPSWHKGCNNWQLKSSRGYIMSVGSSWVKKEDSEKVADTLLQKLKEGVKLADVRAMGVEMINVLREKAVIAKHRGADAGSEGKAGPAKKLTESEQLKELEKAKEAEKAEDEMGEGGEEELEKVHDEVIEAGANELGFEESVLDDAEKDVD